MMDMREKIARAIYESRNGAGCKPWARITGEHRQPYLADATAALTALGEPTPEMQQAALNLVTRQHQTRDIFTAMIRAAKGGSDA